MGRDIGGGKWGVNFFSSEPHEITSKSVFGGHFVFESSLISNSSSWERYIGATCSGAMSLG